MIRISLSVALAFAGLLAVAPAQARFLQTDPVGYQDDLDWYAYVQDDPTDKVDPTGKTCDTINGQYSCHIDTPPSKAGLHLDQQEAQDRQVRDFNKRYTDTVNKLANGKASAQISLSKQDLGGKGSASMTITGKEIAQSLAARNMVYDASAKNPSTNQENGVWTTHVSQDVFLGNAAPKFGGVSAGVRGSNITLVHEGIHGSQAETDMLSTAGASYGDLSRAQPGGAGHQQSYDDAAIALYGPN